MSVILKAENLSKTYRDVIAVNNVSFSLEKGKIYGLLGPNGAGKTTIMKLLTDIIAKDKGKIEYGNIKIKYLMDVPMFYEYMKVEEYLTFLGKLNKLQDLETYIINLLDKANLTTHKDKKIKQLSRGLRQKLGIASVLIGDVDILILDEPISALDPVGRKEILNIIMSLKGDVTVIFSSHILVDIEKVCDHILLVKEGKIILDSEVSQLNNAKNYLLVKCSNREEALTLKNLIEGTVFSFEYENTLEIEFEDLISKQQEILRHAKKNNLRVEKIEIKKETLEEIFLKGVNVDE